MVPRRRSGAKLAIDGLSLVTFLPLHQLLTGSRISDFRCLDEKDKQHLWNQILTRNLLILAYL